MIEHPIWLFIYKSFVKSWRNFTNSFMKHPPDVYFVYTFHEVVTLLVNERNIYKLIN